MVPRDSLFLRFTVGITICNQKRDCLTMEDLVSMSGHSHSTVEGKSLTPDAWLAQAPFQGKDAVKVDLQLKQGERKKVSVTSKLLNITKETPIDEDLRKIFAPTQK